MFFKFKLKLYLFFTEVSITKVAFVLLLLIWHWSSVFGRLLRAQVFLFAIDAYKRVARLFYEKFNEKSLSLSRNIYIYVLAVSR